MLHTSKRKIVQNCPIAHYPYFESYLPGFKHLIAANLMEDDEEFRFHTHTVIITL